jgi:hypothetical protein
VRWDKRPEATLDRIVLREYFSTRGRKVPPRDSGCVVVELKRLRRRGSWGWWCVLLPALLTIGVYLLFEVLDVVGSRLPSRLAGEAVAAIEVTSIEADRLAHLSVLVASPANPIPSGETSPSLLYSRRLAGGPSPDVTPFRFRSVLARARIATQAFPATSPTADPF